MVGFFWREWPPQLPDKMLQINIFWTPKWRKLEDEFPFELDWFFGETFQRCIWAVFNSPPVGCLAYLGWMKYISQLWRDSFINKFEESLPTNLYSQVVEGVSPTPGENCGYLTWKPSSWRRFDGRFSQWRNCCYPSEKKCWWGPIWKTILLSLGEIYC